MDTRQILEEFPAYLEANRLARPQHIPREIQELLGHRNVETTMVYTHVMRQNAPAVTSPLDRLLAAAGAEGADT